MKKILSLLFVFGLFVMLCGKSVGMTFSEASGQKKPFAVLIYADWADNAGQAVQNFALMEQQYPSYNFVKLNIADKDTKNYNKTCMIMQNLPYVMLYKDGIKFSRRVDMACVIDASCFKDKLYTFAN